jgi:hypothetical protein
MRLPLRDATITTTMGTAIAAVRLPWIGSTGASTRVAVTISRSIGTAGNGPGWGFWFGELDSAVSKARGRRSSQIGHRVADLLGRRPQRRDVGTGAQDLP